MTEPKGPFDVEPILALHRGGKVIFIRGFTEDEAQRVLIVAGKTDKKGCLYELEKHLSHRATTPEYQQIHAYLEALPDGGKK